MIWLSVGPSKTIKGSGGVACACVRVGVGGRMGRRRGAQISFSFCGQVSIDWAWRRSWPSTHPLNVTTIFISPYLLPVTSPPSRHHHFHLSLSPPSNVTPSRHHHFHLTLHPPSNVTPFTSPPFSSLLIPPPPITSPPSRHHHFHLSLPPPAPFTSPPFTSPPFSSLLISSQ